jgi:hypothetical protein
MNSLGLGHFPCTQEPSPCFPGNGEVFDLAAVNVLRDRERGLPRYDQFRA